MVIENSEPQISSSNEMTLLPHKSNTQKLIIDPNVNVGEEMVTATKRPRSPALGASKKGKKTKRFIWDK